MKNLLKENWPIIILLILAVVSRFWHLDHPAQVVFDEVHFGKFASAYFTHKYYFDIHPPLGKLIIAGFARIFGYQGDFDFSQIGQSLDVNTLVSLRLLPAFLGALFPILIYFLIKNLGGSRKAAFLAGFLIVFDNAFLTQSKFILLDIFLLFFGFLSLLFLALAKKEKNLSKKQLLLYSLTAASAGLCFSIKWTGLLFLGITIFVTIIELLKKFDIKSFILKSGILLTISILVYASFFAIHFKLLKLSGPGDAFMSVSFQKTLEGNSIQKETEPLSFWKKFIELNKVMYTSSAGLKATHPNASQWYQWPVIKKPIWYWTRSFESEGKKANIYLIGNPLIWWPVALGVFLLLLRVVKKDSSQKISFWIDILLFGFFMNLFPFIFINRVAFLYHYLASLAFGVLALVLVLDSKINISQQEEKPYKLKKMIEKEGKLLPKGFLSFSNKIIFFLYFGYLILVIIAFIALSPLGYGLPVSEQINDFYNILIKFLS